MTLKGSIIPGSKWGDPRAQARQANERARVQAGLQESRGNSALNPYRDTVHGMTPNEVERLRDRFENFMPQMANAAQPYYRAREFFDGFLPAGANLDPGAGAGIKTAMTRRGYGNMPGGSALSTSNGSFQTNQQPYLPEIASADRASYPIHRNLANIYWRLFNKLDPIIGTCVDLYSQMIWSNFQLSGEGVEGEIKETLEYMCETTQLRALLPYFVQEFLVIGEVAPHLFYNDNEGIWTHIALHNPDQLEVTHAPFLPNMEPLVEFRPDDRLRSVLSSPNPMLQSVRDSMPEDVIAAIMSGQNIPLSPINCSFIARKLHPYDVRGTSIISRMWRILMYEDAIFNASIAVARRAAAPLKLALLGDPATGWIPGPEQERKLLEMLVQAEQDPCAWLVYNFALEIRMEGAQERAWKIEQTADFIERTKLLAMGISRAFLQGEVSYASAASGLSVFLQRLKATREFFESMWLYPKFFRPVAEMNKWIKPTQAELDHRVRTKRSRAELHEANRYIMPKMEWERPLDPSIDSAMIQAITALSGLGVRFSKTTLTSLVNRDFEKELQQVVNEAKMEQDLLQEHPELSSALAGGGDAGGGPGGLAPGMPPESLGLEPPPDEGGGGEPAAGEPPAAAEGDPTHAHGGTQWDADGRSGAWTKEEANELVALIQDGDLPDEEPWTRMLASWKEKGDDYGRAALRAIASGNGDVAWEAVEEWLLVEGYPPKDVRNLEAILQNGGHMAKKDAAKELERYAQLIDKSDNGGSLQFLVGYPSAKATRRRR